MQKQCQVQAKNVHTYWHKISDFLNILVQVFWGRMPSYNAMLWKARCVRYQLCCERYFSWNWLRYHCLSICLARILKGLDKIGSMLNVPFSVIQAHTRTCQYYRERKTLVSYGQQRLLTAQSAQVRIRHINIRDILTDSNSIRSLVITNLFQNLVKN